MTTPPTVSVANANVSALFCFIKKRGKSTKGMIGQIADTDT
jgi:hypothetical protein